MAGEARGVELKPCHHGRDRQSASQNKSTTLGYDYTYTGHNQLAGHGMGLCMRCARLNKPDGPTKSQLSQSAPPSTWPTQTSSHCWPSQQPRWLVRQRRQRQLFVAAVDISTDAAPAVSPVPVLAPTEPASDASREKPYICHSWKWRGHKINYAVRLVVLYPGQADCHGVDCRLPHTVLSACAATSNSTLLI